MNKHGSKKNLTGSRIFPGILSPNQINKKKEKNPLKK